MKRKNFLIIILIILLILIIFIFVNKKILLKGKTTNLDNSTINYSNSLENNTIIESDYYNTAKLQQFVMEDKTKKILRINGIEYTQSDIKLRQYFQGEESEKTYNETINVIILYNEAQNRNIKIELDKEKKIKEEIYNIKFENDFLNNIQYSDEELKQNFFEIYMEYELVKELKIQINNEIFENNISIESSKIKNDAKILHNLFDSIKQGIQSGELEEAEEKKLYSEYKEKMNNINNEYLNYIKEKYEVKYL